MVESQCRKKNLNVYIPVWLFRPLPHVKYSTRVTPGASGDRLQINAHSLCDHRWALVDLSANVEGRRRTERGWISCSSGKRTLHRLGIPARRRCEIHTYVGVESCRLWPLDCTVN